MAGGQPASEVAKMPTENYGQALRAIGWLLDTEQGQRPWIEEHPAGFQVRWSPPEGPPTSRTVDPAALQALQGWAQGARERPSDPRQGELAELLRTLGQELDDRGMGEVELYAGVTFRVLGVVQGASLVA